MDRRPLCSDMDSKAVEAWLEKRTRRLKARCRALGVVCLALFPIGLGFSLALIYVALRVFTFNVKLPGHDPGRLYCWITLGCVPVLFLVNRLFPRPDPMKENMERVFDLSFFGRQALRYQGRLRVIAWYLLIGPRLLEWAVQLFRESRTLTRLDAHTCAAVLSLLMARAGKVSLDELQRNLDCLDLEAASQDLKTIPGVLFLQSPPPGLSLTQDLRDAIRAGQAV